MNFKFKQTPEEVLQDFFRRAPVGRLIVPPSAEVRSTLQRFELPVSQPVEEHKSKPVVSRRTLGADPPPAPVIFDTDHGTDNIRLHWHPVVDPASGTMATVRYTIYRNITGFGGFTRIVGDITGGTTADRTYHNMNLPYDTDIYYYMTATGESGDEGPASSPVTIVHTDPASPPPPPPGVIPDHFNITEEGTLFAYNSGALLHFRAVDTANVVVNFNGYQPIFPYDQNGDPNHPSFMFLNGGSGNNIAPVYIQFVAGLATVDFRYQWRNGFFYSNVVTFSVGNPYPFLQQFGYIIIRGFNA